MRNILKRKTFTAENIICLAFASVFLHYVLTVLALLGISIYILFNYNARKSAFRYYGKTLFIIFTVYAAVIALIRDNFIGFACTVGFFAIFLVYYYVRSEITGDVFQKGLDISCGMSWIVFVSVVAEKLMYSHQEDYRCASWFLNSNYLCSVMAMVVIVCVYKLLISQKGFPFYTITAILCFVTIYLSGSIFAMIEMVVGIFTLLLLYKKRSIITVGLIIMLVCVLIIYAFPQIFPRILESDSTTNNRILVWDSSLDFIKKNIFLGQGFLGYQHMHELYGSLWKDAHHTHNFLFEIILNFGLIGSSILVAFLWTCYEKVAECKSLLRKTKAANLILAISTATIIHCTVDMTIQWVQTGLLFALILAGIGVDEKALDRRIRACLAKSEKKIKSPEEETDNG